MSERVRLVFLNGPEDGKEIERDVPLVAYVANQHDSPFVAGLLPLPETGRLQFRNIVEARRNEYHALDARGGTACVDEIGRTALSRCRGKVRSFCSRPTTRGCAVFLRRG